MLIIFGGLPGTGKSDIGRELAREHAAVYLRIDSIEQAIRISPMDDTGIASPMPSQGIIFVWAARWLQIR